MSVLTDKHLREALLCHLQNRPVAPRAVLQELRVHNGNAVADVVAVNRIAHCYELKGETDNLSRVLRQASFYDQAFQRVTLVTTPKHVAQALLIVPAYWGVMVADDSGSGVALRYLRKSSTSPAFDKRAALLTLWRAELVQLCLPDTPKLEKLSRSGLSEAISARDSAERISQNIAELLCLRHATNGWSVAM